MARVVHFHEYGDASVLKIENLDVPPPGPDEVQLDIKSIGLAGFCGYRSTSPKGQKRCIT